MDEELTPAVRRYLAMPVVEYLTDQGLDARLSADGSVVLVTGQAAYRLIVQWPQNG